MSEFMLFAAGIAAGLLGQDAWARFQKTRPAKKEKPAVPAPGPPRYAAGKRVRLHYLNDASQYLVVKEHLSPEVIGSGKKKRWRHRYLCVDGEGREDWHYEGALEDMDAFEDNRKKNLALHQGVFPTP